MKTLRCLPAVLALAFGCALPFSALSAVAPDRVLIEKLPEREAAAKKTAHLGWDSHEEGKMVAATNAYDDALIGMVNELAAAHYTRAKITREDVAAFVKALRAVAEFRRRLDNPTGEERHVLDAMEAPFTMSADLEGTVELMVEAVTGDDEQFDFPAWQKRWTEATLVGDEAEKATPAPSPSPAAAASPAGKPEAKPAPSAPPR